MPAAELERRTPAPVSARTSLTAASVVLLAILGPLTGCAKQREPGYYDPPPASTQGDAQYNATGAGYRTVVRAPSQLQFDLKRPAPTQQQQQQAAEQQQAAQAGEAAGDGQAAPATIASADAPASAPAPAPAAGQASKLVPQPQTYMGTLPCFSPGLNCEAQRITLTLAPNGRWRGRSAYLADSTNKEKAVAEQGCWDATDEKPPRVFLTGADGNSRAEFVVAANNVLRLRALAGVTPNLNYTLTRQPDLDPIDELSKQPPPKCGN
ncbi:copper resistance protein NlpE N-terminal domain-containing protein [Achromobacter aloeverae]